MATKIPALRVEVNGELIAIAGAEGLSMLSGNVSVGADRNRTIDVSGAALLVMGLDVLANKPKQLTWANGLQLKLGDRVTFEIAEVEQPSPPDKVLSTPSSDELVAAGAAKRRKT